MLDQLDQYLSENFEKNDEGMYIIYDTFSFDEMFIFLLSNDFEYEDALYFILANCSLSAIVFQERIHNEYYLYISNDETMSDDLTVHLPNTARIQ